MTDSYSKDIIEIQDLIPKKLSNHLRSSVMDCSFPWYFVREISAPYKAWRTNELNNSSCEVGEYSVSGFVHELYSKGKVKSEYYKEFVPILYLLEEAASIEIESLIEFRLNLFTRNTNTVPHHIPHIDISADGKIMSALYYVNNSDGDTRFFTEFFDPDIKRYINGYSPSDFHIQTTSAPEQGKVILFDSRRYHASSYPEKTPERIVLNMVFKIK